MYPAARHSSPLPLVFCLLVVGYTASVRAEELTHPEAFAESPGETAEASVLYYPETVTMVAGDTKKPADTGTDDSSRTSTLACGGCATPECEPWALIGETGLGFNVTGWVAQGLTHNTNHPTNPPGGFGNLPTTFNYRGDDYQLNQLYLFIERETETCSCGWDLGGRVDLLYGEDYVFTQAIGLETRPDGSARWNTGPGGGGAGIAGSARMGLAMPQLYAELAYDNLKAKFGHFYTMIGYESVMAPENFFYSHAYTMQYGEPFTHNGLLFTWDATDQLTFIGGYHMGWDVFDDQNDGASFLGGVTWTSRSGCTSLSFAITSGEEPRPRGLIGLTPQTMYSLVFKQQLTSRIEYVLQHDYGWQNDGAGITAVLGTQHAEWYGINQYLFYTINDRWKLGLRYEWFRDDDGARVVNFAGNWNELTLGLNWTPHPNIVVRPEVRWDWFDTGAGTPPGPFDAFTRRDQFLAAIDAIIRF